MESMQNKHSQINEWINTYTEDLLSWTRHKISDTESAKDIVQETFLAVSKNVESFEQKSNPRTWIFSILNNKISDYYRKKYKEGIKVEFDVLSTFFSQNDEWNKDKRPLNWQNDETHLLDDIEFIEILNYCLEHLPGKFNTVIKMKYYSEKNPEEICQELEISSTNMWQIMHRAKLKLRDCIENGWFKNN